jgi:hypothetical protein
MSTNTNGANPTTPDEIEADIARQREALARTVDHLHDRLDVKSRAQAKAAEVKDRATTDEGKPRPEVLAVGAAVLAALIGLTALKIRRTRNA